MSHLCVQLCEFSLHMFIFSTHPDANIHTWLSISKVPVKLLLEVQTHVVSAQLNKRSESHVISRLDTLSQYGTKAFHFGCTRAWSPDFFMFLSLSLVFFFCTWTPKVEHKRCAHKAIVLSFAPMELRYARAIYSL